MQSVPDLSQKRQVIAFPYPVYFFTVIGLAFSGLAVSVYLFISHYRVYSDISYRSFCAISKAINCDTVSQSSFSIFLNIPLPIWGIVGYIFIILIIFLGRSAEFYKERMWAIVYWLAMGFSCYSVVLAFISSYYIGSYCFMCIATYAINFLLWLYAWIIRRRFSLQGIFKATQQDILFVWQKKNHALVLFFPFLIAVVIMKIYLPLYWDMSQPQISLQVPTGVTEEGHHWIGAQNPVIIIEEFADYQCFQCKKMHLFLRQLIHQYPDKIRLVHWHYPMDHEFNPIVDTPFHVGSGKMAMLAIYAGKKGKFWEMNDILFDLAGKSKTLDIKEIAGKTGLNPGELSLALESRQIRELLDYDIWHGMKSRITGTPGYRINGRIHLGSIPSEVLKKAIGN